MPPPTTEVASSRAAPIRRPPTTTRRRPWQTTTSATYPPNIIVNEIHYNPCDNQGGDFDWEYAEFYNAGDDADLSGYEVWFAFSNPEAISLALTFPEGTLIPADSYFLVVPGAVAETNYTAMGITCFLMDNGNWGNGGGTVQLQDACGNIVDAGTYDDADPWPSRRSASLVTSSRRAPMVGVCLLELSCRRSTTTIRTTGRAAGWTTERRVQPTAPPSAAPTAWPATTLPSPCSMTRAAPTTAMRTYPEASNYDENATVDDGTCEVTAENNCPTDLNGDGTTTVSDLLILLGAFASDCAE